MIMLILAWVVLVIIAEWKIFTKAGKHGWKSLIPIYSDYTMLQILNMEPLLCLLMLLPGANFMLKIVMQVRLAHSFKKGTGFAIGLILLSPIFEMILGFGSAKYTQLPSAK
ncbi:signal peptidase I [Candidatus Saccharibacteria bacterium]|nr:signal peptidase I [Candidatus Saccharibacteria bacterium]